MRNRRERLLVILLMVLCAYAVMFKDSISEAMTSILFNDEQIISANNSTISITSNIPNNSTIKHGYRVSITISDSKNGLRSYTYKENNGKAVTPYVNAKEKTIAFTAPRSGKEYKIFIEAENSKGEKENKTFTYKLGTTSSSTKDKSAPIIEITPGSGKLLATDKIKLTVVDTESGIKEVRYSWNNGNPAKITPGVEKNIFSINIPKPNTNGTFLLQVTAENESGLKEIVECTYTIGEVSTTKPEETPAQPEQTPAQPEVTPLVNDTTAPEINITMTLGSNFNEKIKLIVEEKESEIEKVTYKWHDGIDAIITPGIDKNKVEHEITGLDKEGVYKITVTARNALGLASTKTFVYYEEGENTVVPVPTPTTVPEETEKCIHTGTYTGGPYAGWFISPTDHWVYCECGIGKEMKGIGSHEEGTNPHNFINGVCNECGYKEGSPILDGKAHKIEKGDIANGQVNISRQSACKDEKITVEAIPNSGYKFEKFSILTESGKNISAGPYAEGNKAVFTMPDEAVTVSAVFVAEQTQASTCNHYGVRSGPYTSWLANPTHHWVLCKYCGVEMKGYGNSEVGQVEHTFINGKCDACNHPDENSYGTSSEPVVTPTANEYKINYYNNSYGKIIVTVDKAKAGEIISVRAEPNEGYEFIKWVPGKNGIVYSNENALTTTFVMPDEEVYINAKFEKITTSQLMITSTPYDRDKNSMSNNNKANHFEWNQSCMIGEVCTINLPVNFYDNTILADWVGVQSDDIDNIAWDSRKTKISFIPNKSTVKINLLYDEERDDNGLYFKLSDGKNHKVNDISGNYCDDCKDFHFNYIGEEIAYTLHTLGNEYSYDDNYHYKNCTDFSCDYEFKSTKEKHEIITDWNDANYTYHFKKCKCGKVLKKEEHDMEGLYREGSHVESQCKICGYKDS